MKINKVRKIIIIIIFIIIIIIIIIYKDLIRIWLII